MRIMKIGNNQQTGTNQPTNNPSQPAFKMKFSKIPRHINELDELFKQLETLSRPNLRTALEFSLLSLEKERFNRLKINRKHPIVNIKQFPKCAEGLSGNYIGYKVQVIFKDSKSGETLETSSTGVINSVQKPIAISLNLRDVIEIAFVKMKQKVLRESKKAINNVETPTREFIKEMNA